MSRFPSKSHGEFLYNAQYRILICLDCSYAIQKSAIASHLLRHKVYRTERQRLLDSFAKLDLCEPQHVRLPLPGAPPVEGLPVIDGLQCTISGCRNLCASEKRMRKHWGDFHAGLAVSDGVLIGKKTKMQTFFRGTMIKYFEVDDATTASPIRLTSPSAKRPLVKQIVRERDRRTLVKSKSLRQPDVPVLDTILSAPLEVEMESMSYFHHYITVTSHTLPHPLKDHWQTHATHFALQHKWLMCGLLSISAQHLGTLADDETTKRVHTTRALQFHGKFRIVLDTQEAIMSEATSVRATFKQSEESCKLGRQIAHLLNLARWLPKTSSTQAAVEDFAVFMRLIRSLSNAQTIPKPAPGPVTSTPTVVRDPDTLSTTLNTSSPPLKSTQTSRSELVERLRTLPPQIALVLGRPQIIHVADVLTTISAISLLVDCVETLIDGELIVSTQLVWDTMSTFAAEVSEEFYTILERGDVAPMVVAAHWLVVVRWALDAEFWFMKGALKGLEKGFRGWLEGEGKVVAKLIEVCFVLT